MSDLKPTAILLIEDDPAQACYVSEILSGSSFEIVHVSSMAAAVESIRARSFDVILQDLSLPDSEGIGTVQSIVAHAGSIPVVVLTGIEDEALAIQAVQLGAQDYLQKKEISETIVTRTIRYAIERKRAEELSRAQDRALESSKLKSVFLGNMSHELRTPLTGIIGMNELLLQTQLSREQLECAVTVRDCAEELLTLVEDLLDISSIELGGIAIRESPMLPLFAVEAVSRELEPVARDKNLKITNDFSPDIPISVLGDRERLQQVLLNLARNAVKFTNCGEIRLATSVESRDEFGVVLKFAVTDTGIGIAEKERKLLFTPFTQVDSSTTRRYGGAGLGLAISKRLVELMGGEIGVESEKDRGSTFWFTVPFRLSDEDRDVPAGA